MRHKTGKRDQKKESPKRKAQIRKIKVPYQHILHAWINGVTYFFIGSGSSQVNSESRNAASNKNKRYGYCSIALFADLYASLSVKVLLCSFC